MCYFYNSSIYKLFQICIIFFFSLEILKYLLFLFCLDHDLNATKSIIWEDQRMAKDPIQKLE